MRKDTRLHVGAGLLAGAFGALVALGVTAGWLTPGAVAALTSTAAGIGWELAQRIRGEGVPTWDDAVATAAPGWLAWAAEAALRVA